MFGWAEFSFYFHCSSDHGSAVDVTSVWLKRFETKNHDSIDSKFPKALFYPEAATFMISDI